MKRRKQSRRWRGKKYAPVMIGMLVLLMNLADLKNSNLISGSIICQAAERQSENTETENNSGGTEKEKITQTEASTVSDILEELDLSRVQRMLDQMLGEESFSMKDMLDGLIKGEKVLSEDTVQEMVHSFLFSGLEKEKSLLIKILLLILLSAVLANFADVFESGQIGDICFYIVYLLLFILLMASFSSVTRSVQQTITWMAEFMRGLAPAYFLTISIAAGSSTAAVFYEGVLILTWLIQEVILNLLFPGACLYVLISLINNLSKEEMLGKMAELLDTAVSWGLKTLLGMVVGLQVVRGLIAPVMDTLKRSATGKGSRCAARSGECSEYGYRAGTDKCGTCEKLPWSCYTVCFCGSRGRSGDPLWNFVPALSISGSNSAASLGKKDRRFTCNDGRRLCAAPAYSFYGRDFMYP